MNQKRYWLRGLIIGFFFLPVLWIIASLVATLPQNIFGEWLLSAVQFLLAPFSVLDIEGHCGSEQYACVISLSVGFVTITYMLVGAIIGWLYGKVKNRSSARL